MTTSCCRSPSPATRRARRPAGRAPRSTKWGCSAAGGGVRRVGRSAGLASALVIGVALALPAGGYALLEGLRALAGRVSFEPQLSLFLRPEAKRADTDALRAALKADGRVTRLRFV